MLKRIARWILRDEIKSLNDKVDWLKLAYSQCAAGPWMHVPDGHAEGIKHRVLISDGCETTLAVPRDRMSWRSRIRDISYIAEIRTPNDYKRHPLV